MSKILICVISLCLMCFVGCGKPTQVVSSDPVCLPFSTEQLMDAARDVLDEMHFTLEKDDPQSRYLRTRPLSGAQFFQFWRHDNADAYASAQSNLHSLRRIVEMEFSPGPDTVCMACRVQVQRLSIPERPIEGTHNMGAAFTDSDNNRQTVQIDEKQLEKMEWLDAGPDRALEQKIVKQIEKKLQRGKRR
jgi:hypothetical protein